MDTTDLAGGGWVGAGDTGGGGTIDRGLLEFLGDPTGRGKNGIVIDGLVAWINVVHDEVAENVWKEQAENHYDSKEVTDAKVALWKASGGQAGDSVQRQGGNKKKMEIDDIHKGLRKLKSDAKLPLILSSCGMMARAPNLSGISATTDMGDVAARVKDLEESMGTFMKKQCDQMKELAEMVSVNSCKNKLLPPRIDLVKENDIPESPRTKRKRQEVENDPLAPPHEQFPSYASAVSTGRDDGVAKADVANTLNPLGGIAPLQKPGARKNSVLVFGNATTSNGGNEETLAADVELVATGVSRDASTEQLSSFLLSKGIEVVDIALLTTYEHARTNTFKIKIKASQYTKAMSPDVWPFRVGVRHYRQPRRDQNITTWAQQSAQSGGVLGQQQPPRPRLNSHRFSQQYNQTSNNNQYQFPPQYLGPAQYPQPVHGQQYPPVFPGPTMTAVPIQNRFVVDGFSSNISN